MRNKKGFTLVELVIVIAVIAILAGVMIAVFANVVKDAQESAKLQELKSQEIAQKADDIIKKVDNANWLGWEDFEDGLVARMTEVYVNTKKGEQFFNEIEDLIDKEEVSIEEATKYNSSYYNSAIRR